MVAGIELPVFRDMIGEWLGHFSGSCLEPKVHF
jgi:hypothetical protein